MTTRQRSRTTLSAHAYDTLRELIVRGDMPPESRISEAELTERLDVGRTPLREALLRLAQDGLVAIYPQSGSFVAPISLEQLEEAQFIRERLESGIIRRVAERAGKRALADLRSLVQRQEQAWQDDDPERFHGLDDALHAGFCEIAGWPDIWQLIHRSKAHMDRVRRLSLPIAGHIPNLIAQHRAILDAVVDGDADAAEGAMRGHLREIFAVITVLQLDRSAQTRGGQSPSAGDPSTGARPILQERI